MAPARLMLRPGGSPVALNVLASAPVALIVSDTISPGLLICGPGLVSVGGSGFTVQLNWMLPDVPSCVALILTV